MPTGTFEYRDEAERAAIAHAIAFVARMRDLAVTAPHGHVLDRLEGHAADAGREPLRGTRERAVPAGVDDAEGKGGGPRLRVRRPSASHATGRAERGDGRRDDPSGPPA